jgi:hypothetical protein
LGDGFVPTFWNCAAPALLDRTPDEMDVKLKKARSRKAAGKDCCDRFAGSDFA